MTSIFFLLLHIRINNLYKTNDMHESFSPPVLPVDMLKQTMWKAKSINTHHSCVTPLVSAPQRCRMNEDTGAEYLTPWQLSECMDGGGVGVVESSRSTVCAEGDVVTCFNWPWQTHAVMKGCALQKVWRIAVCQHCIIFHLAEKEDAFKMQAWILTPVAISCCCVSLLSIAGWATAGWRALVSLFGRSRHNRPHRTVWSEGEGQYHQRGQSDHGGEWCGWGLRLHSWTGKYSKLQNWVYKCFDVSCTLLLC